MFHGRRDPAEAIKLMNLRREGYPGIPKGAQRHHKGPGKFKREAGEDSVSVVPREKDPTGLLLALGMEGARSSGTQDDSRDRKCKEVDASLEPPWGTQPAMFHNNLMVAL